MTYVFILPALALLLLAAPAPVFAQSLYSHVERQSYAGQKQRTKQLKANQARRTTVQRSPSGNPAWDVYVNGDYVGSDPDPRIRETLKQEYKGRYGLR